MNYTELLNEEQLKPVMDTEGSVLVLAGAGSGKTRVLTYRIARLIKDLNISPYNILAITFTNKAAREMNERVARVTGENGVLISTFHSLCARILRYDIAKLGYTSDFSIYTASDSDKVIKRILAEKYIDDDKLKKNIQYHISNAKNLGLSPDQYEAACDFDNAKTICDIYRTYESVMRANNALDFDDLLLKTITLFLSDKEVLGKWQDRFRYIHVDEFQDTNKIQLNIVRLLGMKHGNVFAVGDDDQSIYGWRGADVENILRFKDYFPGCRVYKLQQNYRSTQNILNCANQVISFNKSRMGKELFTVQGEGMKVTYRSMYSDKDEADYVLREIDGLVRNNGYTHNDFAILVRLNSLTRKFEEQLAFYGIPYRLYGGFKFYERKEIQDIIAYLRMIVNIRDQEAIVRVINFPKRGIGDMAITKLKTHASERGMSLADAILDIDNIETFNSGTKLKISGFKDVMTALMNAGFTLNLTELIDAVIRLSGIKSAYDATNLDDQNRLDNIDEFVSSVKEYALTNKEATLNDYIQSVALISDTDEVDETEKVTLATIHSVKGLEYRCVFIVGVEEQIFPSARAIGNPKEEEEERRCMYVAITRAKERLYLTSTQSRFRNGKVENNLVSRFIKEAGLITSVIRSDGATKSGAKYDLGKLDHTDIANQLINQKSVVKSELTKDLSGFAVGVTVTHNRYGDGLITALSGDNATVKFEKLGIKEFNLRLAPIIIKK